MNAWDWWQAKLAGEAVEMNEGNPHAGFYRQAHKEFYGARKTFTPVAYWPGQNGELNCRIGDEDVTPQRGRDIWPTVGNHPVTEEAYRNKCQEEDNPNYTGLWPDEHELVQMGHNRPPEDDEPQTFEHIKDQIENLAREAQTRLDGPFIADQDEADRVANLADRLAELHKIAEGLQDGEKKPFSDGMKAVVKKWAPILVKAELFKNLKYTLLTPWAKKIAEANKQKEAAAAAEGKPFKAERPKMGTRGRAMTPKRTKTAKITDYPQALAFFAESDEIKECVQKLANRAVRTGSTPPGCTVEEDVQVV